MRMRSLVLVLAVGAVALSPQLANAHDLKLVVKLPPESPDLLIAEGGFDDDAPAEQAKVTISDASGTVVIEGKTDDHGVCKFTRPGPGKYTAKIVAFGHRDQIEFEIAGLATSEPTATEYRGWRPDKTFGLIAGVSGLLLVAGGYWLLRRRKSA